MYVNLGTVRPGSTVFVPFHTFDSNDPSASVTITGLAVTDIEVYKDASMTQRASDSGYALVDTDGIDLDTITGIHGFTIDLADNTTSGFWAAGSSYVVVVSSVTVDAATVNFIAARFRIGHEAAVLNTTIATLASQTSFTLTTGPAEDDALNGMWCIIHDVASAVQMGYAVISDYTGSTKTVTLAAGTTFTAAATDNISIMGPMPVQPTVTGRTLDISSTGEAGIDWANVGSPTTSLNLSATTISTSQAVASVSGAVGSVTGNVGGNVVGSVASVTGAVGSVTGNVGGNVTGSVGSVTGLTNASIADQVWEEAIADHSGTSGSTAEALNAAGAAGDPWTTSLPGSYTGSQAGKMLSDILTDTGTTLPATLTNIQGATFDTSTDSLEAIRNRGDAAWLTATGFSTHSAADVWAAATRTLTANTNLNDPTAAAIATAVLTTQMTESYAANGVAPTLAQSVFAMHQGLFSRSISGTTETIRKLDNSTTAFLITLNDGTSPTANSRA